MPNDTPVPLVMWLVLPIGCAVCAAVAAVMHYGAAVRGHAKDLPDLPMAMLGGAVAGALSAVLALVWVGVAGGKLSHPHAVGILFAGLGGEYFGGRCDNVLSAARAGVLAAVVLLPIGVGLMAVIR